MKENNYTQHKKLNLIALIFLVLLIGISWFYTQHGTHDHGEIIAAVASLKFLIISLIFMEIYRAHFFWKFLGIIFSIFIGCLLAFQG